MSGQPVASGAKKSREGKEEHLGGKKAKIGIKGNTRRLRDLCSDKMSGTVGAAKATVWMTNWTIRSPATQQNKNNELLVQVRYSISREGTLRVPI